MEHPAADLAATPVPQPVPFVQPKQWLRWTAVVLAAAGWYVSMRAFQVSVQAPGRDPLLARFCGGPDENGTDSCSAVLTSPQAYLPLGSQAGSLRIPWATFGMAYFAALLLWYIFVGPPTYDRRLWHAIPVLVLMAGIWYSASAISIMGNELHRWCAICLAAHAINAALALVTILAQAWRSPRRQTQPHPSARLALAVVATGIFSLFSHIIWVNLQVVGAAYKDRTNEYLEVINDPQFPVWNLQRQPTADIPLYPDEVFGGSAEAPHTVVAFGDFQCTVCKQAHEILQQVAKKYPDQLRVAFRYYPQDPACNPDPRFRSGGHLSACRAVAAAEAARAVGGNEAYLKMRALLWERQNQLPQTPLSRQTDAERQLLQSWATELGLDQPAFTQAMDSSALADRIRADLDLANKLKVDKVPVIYLDGKRVLGWNKLETWDALLN